MANSVPRRLTNVLHLIYIVDIFGHLMPFLAILSHFKPLDAIFGHFMPIFATWHGKKYFMPANNQPWYYIDMLLEPLETIRCQSGPLTQFAQGQVNM